MAKVTSETTTKTTTATKSKMTTTTVTANDQLQRKEAKWLVFVANWQTLSESPLVLDFPDSDHSSSFSNIPLDI